MTSTPTITDGALPSRAELAILGGGVMGLSIAYQLSRRGLTDVVVIERGYLASSCRITGGTWLADADAAPLELRVSGGVLSSAGNQFNLGLRAYYFGLAALSWFIHPWVFMVVTAGVVLVLYHREFHSRVLKVLTHTPAPIAAPSAQQEPREPDFH